MSAARFDLLVLALGVAAVSTAALLIREAAAPALVIAAYRLTLASLPLMLLAGARRQTLSLSDRRGLLLACLAGVCLALHFAVWIASVQQTSVVTSVVLVTLQPLFVALLAAPLLREKTAPAAWLGIAIALTGATVMVADDFGAGSETLEGDLFALLGAVFVSGYLIIGRRLQLEGRGWLSYVSTAYPASAAALVALTLLNGDAFGGYSTRTYLFMALLALVPQLVGHTALNRSLGRLPAVAVTIAILGEPVGATLLAAVFLGEEPTLLELAGGALVLAGVYAGLRGSFRGAPAPVE